MNVAAKVTPEVLRWARESAGIKTEEVAEQLELKCVTRETIQQWESGQGNLTYSQLEKLAKIYRRPVAVFFFPEPPKEPSLKGQFRSLPESYVDKIPTKIRFLIRDGMVKQMNLYELLGETNPAKRKIVQGIVVQDRISAKNLKAQACNLAAQAREYIGISLGKQTKCKDENEALKMWRNALEECGLWIFKNAFHQNDYCGFCLHDDQFPIIYLNSSMAKSRQIFTLFHELAHLLRRKGGVDMHTTPQLVDDYEEEEVFCNAFAGAFLVPDESFRQHANKNIQNEKIKELAKMYKVSSEVIRRKLLDKNLITQKEYEDRREEWKRKFPAGKKSSKNGGDYYATQCAYLGQKYLQVAFRQYHQRKINDRELADYLGIKTKSLGKLESYVLKGWEE